MYDAVIVCFPRNYHRTANRVHNCLVHVSSVCRIAEFSNRESYGKNAAFYNYITDHLGSFDRDIFWQHDCNSDSFLEWHFSKTKDHIRHETTLPRLLCKCLCYGPHNAIPAGILAIASHRTQLSLLLRCKQSSIHIYACENA